MIYKTFHSGTTGLDEGCFRVPTRVSPDLIRHVMEAVYHLSALRGPSPQGQKKPEVRTLVFQTTQISNL